MRDQVNITSDTFFHIYILRRSKKEDEKQHKRVLCTLNFEFHNLHKLSNFFFSCNDYEF
jgi:hypothetical protein